MSAPYTKINPIGSARGLPMRSLFDRYKKSPLQHDIVESEGIAIGAWYPHRHLPVGWIDIKTQEGVVINKGRVVSLADPRVTISGGMDYPSESGYVYTYVDPTTGVMQSGTMWDTGLRGYESTMGGVIVPANGGYDAVMYYTSADATLGTTSTSGTIVSAAGSGWVNPANRPIGVAREDVYADTRGKYLNGTMMGEPWVGVICDRYIKLPFVDAVKFNDADWSGILHLGDWEFGAAYNDGSTNQVSDWTNSGAYMDVARTHSFLYTISGVNDGGLYPGAFLKSDLYGNWIPEYNGIETTISGDFEASGSLEYSGEVVSGELTVTFDVPNSFSEQTVGRLVEISHDYPQDLLDIVDTANTTDPYNRVTGTATGGLPQELYTFAYDAIYYASSGTITPTTQVIVDAFRSGVFGLARIQVMVA